MSALHRVYCTFAVHHEKSSVPAIFKVSIDHLFANLESGKIKYCFGKSLEKVLNCGFKNLYEPFGKNALKSVTKVSELLKTNKDVTLQTLPPSPYKGLATLCSNIQCRIQTSR